MSRINQASFVENLVAKYGIYAKPNIPGSLVVDLDPRKESEKGLMTSLLRTEPRCDFQ